LYYKSTTAGSHKNYLQQLPEKSKKQSSAAMAPTLAKPLLSDLVAQTGQVPLSHVRPVGDRPDLASVDNESGAGIPLIDLKKLHVPERRKVVEAIGRACESDGFFMVPAHYSRFLSTYSKKFQLVVWPKMIFSNIDGPKRSSKRT
jgi:hypothetical protein